MDRYKKIESPPRYEENTHRSNIYDQHEHNCAKHPF